MSEVRDAAGAAWGQPTADALDRLGALVNAAAFDPGGPPADAGDAAWSAEAAVRAAVSAAGGRAHLAATAKAAAARDAAAVPADAEATSAPTAGAVAAGGPPAG